MASFRILGLLVFICAAILPSTYGMGRIVGGIETTIDRRPYQASLQYHVFGSYVSHSCGASIISTKFLLSAAHCDPGSYLYLYFARVGSTFYHTGGQVLQIESFITHPQHDRPNLDYDVAVLGFAPGVEIILGPSVAIIPLTINTDPADDSLTTVSGWGVTSESSSTAPVNLREADLPVFNQDRCREIYTYLTPRHICLGGTPEGMLSACFGDSGGPAVQNGVQYGVVTGGRSCELPNIPGLFARVSALRDWIAENSDI